MTDYHQWKVISAFEIGYYSVLLLLSVYPSFQILANKKHFLAQFFIRFVLFILFKIVAGACIIAVIHLNSSTQETTSLIIAATVLNSTSLGLIMALILFIVEHVESCENPAYQTERKRQKKLKGKLLILNLVQTGTNFRELYTWMLIIDRLNLVSMILTIVGTAIIQQDVATAKKLSETASILYLIIAVLITAYSLYKLFHIYPSTTRHTSKTSLLSRLVLVISPIVLIRVAYSIAGSFTLEFSTKYWANTSKFSYFFGDWTIYTFMSFMEECIIIALMIFVAFVISSESMTLPHDDQEWKSDAQESV